MTLVDTNILLRYVLKDNETLYLSAKEILTIEKELFVSNEVIAEVIYVLTKTYNVSKLNASEIFIGLLNENVFQLTSKDIMLRALELFSSKNLDFVDCILCATNKINRTKVETFDKSLKKCIDE
ncbi:MAG: PIN domain-containing protein [bacterium]